MGYKIEKLADILKAEAQITAPNADIQHILTDSRALTTAPASSLFFALKTKANDGHRFLQQLYEGGVRNFVVTTLPGSPSDFKGCNFLRVADTLQALQQLAAYHRLQSGANLIAITGSRGKTTLKEYLFQALEQTTLIVRSPRSFNSQIGVPLSIMRIAPQTQCAIIEAGISKKGEMQRLADIIKPSIAVITNIGDEHSEGFASIEEKAAEKAILAIEASSVVYNADDAVVAGAVDRLLAIDPDKQLLGWSRTNPQAPIYIKSVEADTEAVGATRIVYTFLGREESATVPFALPCDIENCIHAIATMLLLGVEPGAIAWRLRNLHPISTRLNVADGVNNCSLIYDAFTSDLSSLESALDFLKRRATDKTPQRTLILSDLHHEDADTDSLYSSIASLAAAARITRFIGVGKALSAHKDAFPEGSRFFASVEELLQALSTSDFSEEIILVKGAPEFGFSAIRDYLEAKTHETVLEVNLDSIVANFNYFRSFLPASTGLIAMVKASGYGAGSYEIAKTLQDHGAAYLAVAVLDEGIDLRQAGITMPIMVMNPKVVNYKAMFAYRLEPEIYCFDMLTDLIREAKKNNVTDYPVHIKLDTGMHRMGFNEEELPKLMEILSASPQIRVATTFSHLATADCPDMNDFTELQLQRFESYTSYMLGHYPHPIKRHILNSAGILRFPQHHYDFARLGIGLYGVNTLPPEMERPLAPVSTLRTVVIAVKERAAGESVGYARKGKITRPSTIATIPIGYADGMNRHFGNGRSKVYINGQYAPTIGNICMDACMIDVTGIPCRPGDIVEIFGPHVSVQTLADILDTIPYEILTSVSPRVKRVYYRE